MKKIGLLFFSIILASWWTFTTLRPTFSPTPALDIWMLDVGQGESVLLREPSGKKILFDGGPSEAVLRELGNILPAWDRQIDLIIISHNHSDHLRGLISVIERYQVKEIWISGAIHTTDEYRALLEVIQAKQLKPRIVFFDPASCQTSCPPSEAVGQVRVQIYHPLEKMTGQRPQEQHDATVAAKFSFENQSVFLTGDLDEAHEKAILTACQPPVCSLQADVLQVPHHGSATGLNPAFLEAVSPKIALIPVGKDNPYDHPRQIILDRLQKSGIPIYRTDLDGRIRIILGKHSLRILTAKSDSSGRR